LDKMSRRGTIKYACIFLTAILVFLFPAFSAAQVHTVSRGDTIYKIAKWYNVEQYALRYTNNLWGDLIYPGQRLVIPSKYNVRRGDTLFLLSKKFGVGLNALKGINKLGSNMIYAGQVLYIPSSPAAAGGVSRSGISRADFDLLARIITAEADSESYRTQVAVGAVVLNRVASPLFPNTIREVVYQVDQGGKYQFEPVLNGWINRPASESGKRAALDALNGWDPTNGALYFFESWVPNKFLQSRPVSIILDSFTFTY